MSHKESIKHSATKAHLPHEQFIDAYGKQGAIDIVLQLEQFECDIIWASQHMKENMSLSLDDRLEQFEALSYSRQLILNIVRHTL